MSLPLPASLWMLVNVRRRFSPDLMASSSMPDLFINAVPSSSTCFALDVRSAARRLDDRRGLRRDLPGALEFLEPAITHRRHRQRHGERQRLTDTDELVAHLRVSRFGVVRSFDRARRVTDESDDNVERVQPRRRFDCARRSARCRSRASSRSTTFISSSSPNGNCCITSRGLSPQTRATEAASRQCRRLALPGVGLGDVDVTHLQREGIFERERRVGATFHHPRHAGHLTRRPARHVDVFRLPPPWRRPSHRASSQEHRL